MKRKCIACLVIVLMVVCMVSSTVLAEQTIDLSQFTIEELLQLRIQLEQEIDARFDSPSATLYPGTYVAGIDIAVGTYLLTGLMDEGPSGYTPQVLWATSLEAASDWDYIDYTYLKTGEIQRINLEDGMALEVREGNCLIEKAPALLFAP